MPELYRCADVFLHMSQDEPSANAYLEALSSGLPVVAHDWEVVRWTMEGLGNLVDTSDVGATAEALGKALRRGGERDVEARVEMIRRRFAWKSIAEEYCGFFEEVVRSAKERPPHPNPVPRSTAGEGIRRLI